MGPPRSLFASLPPDLKRSIRRKPILQQPITSQVEVKVENVLSAMNAQGYLSTQPASPPASVEPIHDDRQSSSALEVDVEVHSTPAESSKRTVEAISEPTPTKRSNKKRKRQSIAPSNNHTDHPWDCTGLLPRYTDYNEVPADLRKYFAQRHLYFPKYDTLPLLLDDTGWYSVTPHPIAAHIADRCQCDTIIDAFCGVGGNAIEFARTCERVIAIDNDPVRLRLARHNALHSGVADRIEFVLADFTDWARRWVERSKGETQKESVDVVFLSPPWGGPEYLKFGAGKYPLAKIEPIPGDELFELTSGITPNIAYFLPKNTDLHELSRLARPVAAQQVGTEGSALGRDREWVEIEEEWVGDKLKAITAYYGGLVAEE